MIDMGDMGNFFAAVLSFLTTASLFLTIAWGKGKSETFDKILAGLLLGFSAIGTMAFWLTILSSLS